MKKLLIPLVALVLMGQSCLPVPPGPEETPVELPPAAPVEMRVFDASGNPVPDNTITKQHRIGQSSCPDAFEPQVIEFPSGFEGAQIAPTTNVSWLDLPEFITSGEPFEMKFNCGITDFTTHSEQAKVTLDFAKYLQEHPGIEHVGGIPPAGTFIIILGACKGPCPDDVLMPAPNETP